MHFSRTRGGLFLGKTHTLVEEILNGSAAGFKNVLNIRVGLAFHVIKDVVFRLPPSFEGKRLVICGGRERQKLHEKINGVTMGRLPLEYG
jgi:hypothetical protein